MNTLSFIILSLTLTLSGQIDIRDLISLRDNPDTKAGVLDLSQTEIAGHTFTRPAYAGHAHFDANIIPQYIFFRSPYDSIILPGNITAIGNGAFSASDITSITIPEGVTSIGDYAFYGCPRLQTVILPSTLRHIGKGAFAACPSLTHLDLSHTAVTEIPERCFATSSSLNRLLLPAGILSVGREAFAATALNTLNLPGVRTLAPYALAGMDRLERVILNKEAQYDKGTLMNDPRLVDVSGMPDIVPPLFAANCRTLVPGNILDTAVHIGEYAFSNNQADILILSAGIMAIDRGAFAGLYALHTINADALLGDTPDIDPQAFSGLNPADITLHVSPGCEQPWRDHPVWGLFNITSSETVGTDIIDNDIAASIVISIHDNTLTITAAEPITAATVHDITGATIANLTAAGARIDYPLDNVTPRILIINASAGGVTRTAKLLR
ncbi:MAG: leucine-rich repeat domain-containing protein [Muribaculaceae bacterium]|nr:leucine-rich repeat domain-containing protein [Muribaculaceae bacterium]